MTDARVIHFEIVGRDQKVLQAYYHDLFGWNLDTNNPSGYGMTSPDDTGVIVGIGATPAEPSTSPGTSRWTTSTPRSLAPRRWVAR